MLRYFKYQFKGNIPAIKGKWFLRVKHGETIDLQGLAAHMSDHNSPFSEGVINGVFKDMVKCMEELMLDGYKIKIGDLAIFSISLQSKGVDDPNNATPQNIRAFKFNARGTGKTTSANIAQKVHVKELDEYSV